MNIVRPVYATFVAAATSLAGCITIGDKGGIGNILNSYVGRGSEALSAPLSESKRSRGKVRFGHLDNPCLHYAPSTCIESSVGPEIDEYPDVLRHIEDRLRDPCDALSQPRAHEIPKARKDAYSEFFGCNRAVSARETRYVELQSVTAAIQPDPKVIKARSYAISGVGR